MTANECPRDCRVRLEGLEKGKDELKAEDAKQWEHFSERIHEVEGAVTERVKTKTLIALFGVLCSVLLAILGFSFSSLKTGQKEAVAELRQVQKDVTTMSVQLEERTRGDGN